MILVVGVEFHEQHLQSVGRNVISRFNNGLCVFWSSTRLDRLPGLNIVSIIIWEFIFYFTALSNFIQINSQNTWDAKIKTEQKLCKNHTVDLFSNKHHRKSD
jgi:hypothetical protein